MFEFDYITVPNPAQSTELLALAQTMPVSTVVEVDALGINVNTSTYTVVYQDGKIFINAVGGNSLDQALLDQIEIAIEASKVI